MESTGALGLCALAALLMRLAVQEARHASAMSKRRRRLPTALALGAYALAVAFAGVGIFIILTG